MQKPKDRSIKEFYAMKSWSLVFVNNKNFLSWI